MTAFAGRPYLLVEETVDRKDVPSWSFNVYDGFEADTVWSNKAVESLNYQVAEEMGKLPWSGWLPTGKKNGPDQDVIRVFAISWGEWNNGEKALRQRTPGAEFESYYFRSGIKKFAVTALDRNELEAPERIHRELNAK